MAPVADVGEVCASADAAPRQLIAKEGDGLGAQRQLGRTIILDHLAPAGHRPQRDQGLAAFRAEALSALVGRREQGKRCFAEPPHLPQPLAAVVGQSMGSVGLGDLTKLSDHKNRVPQTLQRPS